MRWWLCFSVAIAIILLFPYIRFIFKRISMHLKLKTFCKREGLTLHSTRPFWWLGVRRGGGCNFYIETPKTIYSVKLFSTLSKQSCVHFLENRNYYIENFLVIFGSWGTSAKFSLKSRIRMMKSLDFKYKFNDEWNTKSLSQILLINPTCRAIKLKINDNERFVCDGDELFEARAFGLKGLLNEIKAQSNLWLTPAT